MAIDPKSLTVDFRSLLKMTVQERVEMAKQNPSYLASLTPTQYAMLFPDYYRKQLPDLGLSKATSGATPLGTISGDGESATPLPRYDGTTPKTGVDAPPSEEKPAQPKEKPKPSTVLKETWDQRLIREAEERLRPKQSFETDSTRTSIDKRGNVNKQQFYNQAVRTFRNSQLNGFVPKDGKKYGIDGTPESWARFAMRVAKVESNFNVNTINPSDPGGSFGLFQWGKHYGITEENWKDPQAQLDAFVTFSQKWVVEGGGHILPKKGVEAKRKHGYGGFGTVFSTVRNNKVESSTAYSALTGLEEATEVLPPTTDEPGKVIPGGDPGSIGTVAPEPLTSLPEGLDPGIVEHYKTLNPDEQKKLLESMTGVTPETINRYYREDPNRSATPQAVREKTGDIISGKGHPEDQFGVTGTAAQRGLKKVDPRLVKIMEETAKDFPLRVRLFSGIRSKGAHGKGLATDIQIFDESGKPLSSYQTSQTANIYAMFAERARAKQMELFPELDKSFVWGGGWAGMKKGGGAGEYGAADFMDFRIGHSSQSSMRAYKWGEGWQKGYEYYTDNDFLGIGDRPITEEDYAKLEGFVLSDEQERIQREIASKFAAGLSSHGNIGERKYPISPVQPVPEAATEVTTPQTAPPSTEPPAAGTTGSPMPQASGYPGVMQPETKTAPTPPTPTATPAPTKTEVSSAAPPVNPPATKAVTDAMANVGPPGPNQKDYRDNPAVKAEAASQAPTPTEKPSTEIDPIEVKQDDVPQKKYGGTTQSPTGEPITVSDSQTGQRLFTMNEEETLRKNKYGQIEGTPNTRRDSEEIESLAQKVKDEVRLQSEVREAAAETPMTRMSQQPPQNNPNWSKTVTQISEDSGNVYKTASQGRAFDQARFIPRKDIFSLANATLKS